MTLDEFTTAVRPGTGLVGRYPGAVLLVPDDVPGDGLDRLLGLLCDGAPDAGARLEALFTDPAAAPAPAFAAVVQGAFGMTIYVHGALEVAADGPSAQLRVRGRVDGGLRRCDAPDDVVSLTVQARGVDTAAATVGVRSGVVSGDGFVLRRRGAELPVEEAADEVVMAAEAMTTSGGSAAANQVNGSGGGVATLAPPAPAATPPVAPPPPPPVQYTPPLPPIPAQHQTTASPSTPDWLGGTPQQAAPTTGAPTPTYGGRVAARLLSSAVVGGVLTVLLALVLPVGFATLEEVLFSGFIGLALLFALGVVLWDPIYDVVRKRRAAQDWPTPLFVVLALVPEAAAAWVLQAFALPQSWLVDEVTAAIDLGVVAVAVGVGTVLLGRIPATRKLLHSATTPTGTGASTAQQGLGSLPMFQGTPAQQSAPVAGASPLVWGINCQQGHFNRPDARYCASCGTAMHGLTHEPRQAPRPALGYLVDGDGASHVLDRDLVLGTAPQGDAKVAGGRAAALALPDGTGLLGDAHADLELREWDVTVVDRGHPQGTHVREPDSAMWVRLAPGQPFTLTSGSRVRLGTRDLTYHAANTR
ncbi:hypothetical protein [Actinokineospora bangkokensis]|uniref:FHA domain-containing protein n=1 Tax=Actinokineospora bangkokensis TaxID=1193682 RepID=A0A1Q9LIT3_9PSEU|nr:hypothetical protein [Actinokineospora bangkokensis]OLR91910.1 hypothetical protein BJP25_24065 [Actinokineospora bangkokensis]